MSTASTGIIVKRHSVRGTVAGLLIGGGLALLLFVYGVTLTSVVTLLLCLALGGLAGFLVARFLPARRVDHEHPSRAADRA